MFDLAGEGHVDRVDQMLSSMLVFGMRRQLLIIRMGRWRTFRTRENIQAPALPLAHVVVLLPCS